jgi:hypothetical protein
VIQPGYFVPIMVVDGFINRELTACFNAKARIRQPGKQNNKVKRGIYNLKHNFF